MTGGTGARADADAIELAGVTKGFGGLTALAGIGLSLSHRSRTGIVGPSGCGKTTLLQVVAGLLEADAGLVRVGDATTARQRLARCALMPQRDLLLPWRTALDNAAIALQNRGVSRAAARQRTRPLFEQLGLAGFERSRPEQLSGGMRQRVSFLRTLMAEKDVLLLDEPFGALDSITRGQLQEWLRQAMDAVPRTVLLVTHDVDEALLLCQQVVVLSARPGRVVRVLTGGGGFRGSRREIVTSPEFASLKEQALAAIGS
ncbi:MAG TPA: ATP-binding cassette domain-containing protein [Streptosporangiaceae bacterium]|nr:ATP-binding cassette domain-containing protein [Streptosporangiaceae bacterium]